MVGKTGEAEGTRDARTSSCSSAATGGAAQDPAPSPLLAASRATKQRTINFPSALSRLYHRSLTERISFKTLAGFGRNLQNRPKIVRYIANDNPKEARDARSGH